MEFSSRAKLYSALASGSKITFILGCARMLYLVESDFLRFRLSHFLSREISKDFFFIIRFCKTFFIKMLILFKNYLFDEGYLNAGKERRRRGNLFSNFQFAEASNTQENT